MPSFKSFGYHYPSHMLPENCTDLPIVGMVRNHYFFSDACQADFNTTLINLINLGANSTSSQSYRNTLIEVLPETFDGNQGVGLTKNCIRHFIDEDNGYYRRQFKRMHGDLDSAKTYIGRFEKLQQVFLAIMEQLGVAGIKAIRSKFEISAHLNKSRHSNYSAYDDELRELVEKKGPLLINQYGYQFEANDTGQKLIYFPSQQIGGIQGGFQKIIG